MPTKAQDRMQALAEQRRTRFLSILDFDPATLEACLELASRLKTARAARAPHVRPLEGDHVALLFEKPSLRTRATFQIAVRELGGEVIEPPPDTLGGRESLEDIGNLTLSVQQEWCLWTSESDCRLPCPSQRELERRCLCAPR